MLRKTCLKQPEKKYNISSRWKKEHPVHSYNASHYYNCFFRSLSLPHSLFRTYYLLFCAKNNRQKKLARKKLEKLYLQ